MTKPKTEKTENGPPGGPTNGSVSRLRSAYGPKARTGIRFSDKTPTKQSFQDECDINKIMAKFQKTGAINHANRHEPQYAFASGEDFRESLEIISKAQDMFGDLPASIRSTFNNKPDEFLTFVQNPDNLSEMAELGLLTPEATTRRLKALTTAAEAELPPAEPLKPDAEHPALE